MLGWINRLLAPGRTSAKPAEAREFSARDAAEACKNRGNAHFAKGELAEAATWYREAIKADPGYAEAHNNLGLVLAQQDNFDAAIASYRKALALKPALAEASVNLAAAMSQKGLPAEALAALQAALALNPALPEAHNNLGLLLHEQGKLAEALASFDTALTLRPSFAQVHINRGLVFQDQGRLDEAEACFRKAMALVPEDQTARFNLSLLCLASGRLGEGWENYGARFWRHGGTYRRPFPYPEWKGEDLAGKALLVWGDQGLGDEIMFATMFREVIARSKRCVIECVPKLVPLFERSFPGARFVPRTDPPHPATAEGFDCQCAAGDLARWLRPDLASFPRQAELLVPDAARVAHWRARLDELGPGLKVGFCWRSRMRAGVRQLHYTALDQWGSVFAVPGVHFVNLQYDECGDELAAARQRFGVALHAFPEVDLLNDMDEAAALTRALDLVISTPTAACSLAAAVGVATWEIVYGTPWVCLGTDHLPWFRNLRLFRRSCDQTREEVLGQVAAQLRQVAGASPASEAEACKDRGNVHLRRGDLDGAEASYRDAIALDPDYAEARNNLGVVLLQKGRAEDALACFEKALALKPGLAQAHVNSGNALKALARLDAARRHFEAALAIAPDLPDAHNGLGAVWLDQHEADRAIAAFRRAIELQPAMVEAHLNLGNALLDRGQPGEANASFERVLALNPNHADAHNSRGCALKEEGRFDEALACFRQALAAEPNHRSAMLNLGNAYREQLDPVQAQACYERLLALDPANAGAYSNLGMALQDQGKLEEAVAVFRKALALDPDNAAIRFYLSLALLGLGELDEGWRHYDNRFFEGSGVLKREFPFPRWAGESLQGKTLLIWDDQGIGDQILFASMFSEILTRAGRCIVECAPKLVPLFARSFPDATVVPCANPPVPAALSGIDFQIAAGDLARWLRPSLDSFPLHAGYLVPDPARIGFWRSRLDALGPGLKVGFCWRSCLRTGSRHLHYTTLDQWGPIFSVPGVHFVNLQYDRCDAELDAARKAFNVPLHAFPEVDLFNDLDEAAALTAALDLVITAPTSAGRLAAAQGIPTWEMAYGGTWVALGTDHIPWLPAQRMFVLRGEPSWEGIIAAVARELAGTAGKRGRT